MKTFFIETKVNFKVILPEEVIKKLKEELSKLNTYKVGLFTTIQFFDNLEHLKKQLDDKEITALTFQGKHSTYEGQVLGCSTYHFDAPAFLYVGDGLFHPHALAMKNIDKPIYTYDPFTKKFTQLNIDEIKKTLKRKKGAISAFHMKENIGIICSTKPGQNNIRKALKLKSQLEEKGKKAYVFLENTIDYNQLANFPFIEVWINTACPRIMYDDYKKFNKPVLNMADISEFEF